MSEQPKDNWAAGNLYEPYVGRWSRLVAKDFLQWLALPAQLDWLDVGCGTGALTQAILQQMQPRSVTGIDPSAGFIDYAKAHVSDPRVTFEVADAQSLPVDRRTLMLQFRASSLTSFPSHCSPRRKWRAPCGREAWLQPMSGTTPGRWS